MRSNFGCNGLSEGTKPTCSRPRPATTTKMVIRKTARAAKSWACPTRPWTMTSCGVSSWARAVPRAQRMASRQADQIHGPSRPSTPSTRGGSGTSRLPRHRSWLDRSKTKGPKCDFTRTSRNLPRSFSGFQDSDRSHLVSFEGPATLLGAGLSRSRNHGCPSPPPQIRTSGLPASGSCLR